MAYFELNPNGATGAANSAPITLATNHIYPLPVSNVPAGGYSTYGVYGSTGLTTANTLQTVIPAPGANTFLYITALNVVNTSGQNNVEVIFYNGSTQIAACTATQNNGLSSMVFSTPLKLSANRALTAQHTSANLNEIRILAVGFKSSI